MMHSFQLTLGDRGGKATTHPREVFKIEATLAHGLKHKAEGTYCAATCSKRIIG
jgi:hypothetical protein